MKTSALSRLILSLVFFTTSGLLGGCFSLLSSEGGGQTEFEAPRGIDTSDIALPAGYTIEAVATGFTFPTGITFDDQGRLYVTEAGYSYGEVITTPRLLRVEPSGAVTEIASGTNPPWNGVDAYDGAFYVGGGHIDGGQILRVTKDGKVTTLIEGLPSRGDHHTNGPVVGPDGWLYFGQGTATNSGIVGMDNFDFGWPERYPKFHDVPCRDIVLTGTNRTTPNPLTPDPEDEAVTGAYVPFGEKTEEGQVIRGEVPCTGAIMRARRDGSSLEVVAWGFRNPFGLAWSPDRQLYAAENQYDVRGSRPIFGTGDLLWKVEPGNWYGWPDFYGGRPVAEASWFEPPGNDAPELLLQEHPGNPPKPTAMLGVHSSANGLDFSTSSTFGHVGQAFIALFGDMAPAVGKVMAPIGFKVVRVDVETGEIFDFVVNRGDTNGPASWLGTGGLERPVDAAFNPDGTALYVVDFGVMTTRDGVIRPKRKTGVIWRIKRTGK